MCGAEADIVDAGEADGGDDGEDAEVAGWDDGVGGDVFLVRVEGEEGYDAERDQGVYPGCLPAAGCGGCDGDWDEQEGEAAAEEDGAAEIDPRAEVVDG